MPEGLKNILIVEDEVPLSRVLKLKLDHAGFTCDVSYDGKDALEKMEAKKYDIVLLDLILPVLDGFGFLEGLNFMLKKKLVKKKPNVVVLSNLSQKDDIDRVTSLGASRFFVKSATPLTEIVNYLGTV